MAGRWFEEFIVGQTFEHEIRRTVLEADSMWFSNATYNPAPIHIDAEYCKGTELGRPLVKDVRASKSRPTADIVSFLHEGLNQKNEIVCSTLRQALMMKRPEAAK
jgi:acyl dehydratase